MRRPLTLARRHSAIGPRHAGKIPLTRRSSLIITTSVIDPSTRPPAERFNAIMLDVSAALAAQFKEGRLVGALLGRTCGRLRRAGAQVLALAAAFAAGTLRWHPRPERPYRPRPKAPPEGQQAPRPSPVPERPKLPTAFGWLIRRARVAFGRSQMDHLLAQPDMQDLIAAVPPIAHHLRPVCRMLGVKPPPGLFPPRRKPRRPPRPTPPPDPPAPSPAAAAKTPRSPPYLGPELRPIPGIYEPPPPHLRARWFFPPKRSRSKPA